jgi:hypothetical protein
VDSAANSAASAAGSAASAGSSASAAAASADAAEEAANNLTANKYEETTTVVKSVFTIPFAINTMAPNVMIMVNGVVQPPSAYTVTNSTTITLDEAVPIGTNFFLASAAPPTLPNFTDIVRTSAPATLGQDLIFNGSLWTPTTPRHKNFFINGGFEVQQRAEVLMTDVNPKYGRADRWRANLASEAPMSCTLTAGNFTPVYTKQALFAAGLQLTNGYIAITQRIEAKNTIKLGGRWITISATLYHDFGATKPFGIVVERPATTPDDYGSGKVEVHISAATYVPNTMGTVASTTFLISEADAEKGLQVSFQPYENSTFSGKTLAVGEAQLEIGLVKTPFEFRPYGLELALCQRYYEIGTIHVLTSSYLAGSYGSSRTNFANRKRAVPVMDFTEASKTNVAVTNTTAISHDSFTHFVTATAAAQITEFLGNYTANAEL